ncbi:peptidyl-prolyl cis-trans isomerase CYP63 isoform X1 [Tanacetum coccineum]
MSVNPSSKKKPEKTLGQRLSTRLCCWLVSNALKVISPSRGEVTDILDTYRTLLYFLQPCILKVPICSRDGQTTLSQDISRPATSYKFISETNEGEEEPGSYFISVVSQDLFVVLMLEVVALKHVVFGKVVDGIEIIKKIEQLGTSDGKPSGLVRITDCGEISEDKKKNTLESKKGRRLMYEASRDWLPTISREIQSPLGVTEVEFIDSREPVVGIQSCIIAKYCNKPQNFDLHVIPILRAGLALA